jgi:hypothetical protein
MALKSKLGVGVFQWDDQEIKIKSTLSALRSLTNATGKDAIEAIQTATTGMELATVFYHLQTGSQYDEADIYAAFFGRLDNFINDDWQMAFAKCLAECIGTELVDQLKPADDTQKK